MKILSILCLFLCVCLPVSAFEAPLQTKCVVEAEVLSISKGKFYWNDEEFYAYFDIGILVSKVEPREGSADLLVCSSQTDERRTHIVRIWDWNNIGKAWVYEDNTELAQHDVVQLNLSQSYVGDGSWPTIIEAKPLSAPQDSHYTDTKEEILQLLENQQKIQAIKRYREVYGVGLAEAKEAVERLEANMD